MIKINRLKGYADKVRKYKVIVDDKQIGTIKESETKCFDLSEGEHTIYLKIDWCRSNKIKFSINKDEIIEFDCDNSIRGWRIFLNLLYITFLKNKYLWIKIKDKSYS